MKRNGEHIANCRLKIPQGIGDFMDMMPLNFDENAGTTSNAPSRLRWAFRFIVSITSNDNSEVQSEGDKCRKYMLEQARICNDGGGVFSASHRLNHDGCSHTCTR